MSVVRKDNEDWTEEEKVVFVFLSEELFERLVELSVEYCATREMIVSILSFGCPACYGYCIRYHYPLCKLKDASFHCPASSPLSKTSEVTNVTDHIQTTSNTNFTILHQIWCAAILPALLLSEKREFEKLSDIESIQLYKVLARAGRRPHAFYFNNGRKLAKRVGDINEKGMRDEKAAAAAAAGGSGSGKGKGKKK